MMTEVSKYSVPRENNQNDGRFSHHDILHCHIFQGPLEDTSQQRVHILSNASTYLVHTIMTIFELIIP